MIIRTVILSASLITHLLRISLNLFESPHFCIAIDYRRYNTLCNVLITHVRSSSHNVIDVEFWATIDLEVQIVRALAAIFIFSFFAC